MLTAATAFVLHAATLGIMAVGGLSFVALVLAHAVPHHVAARLALVCVTKGCRDPLLTLCPYCKMAVCFTHRLAHEDGEGCSPVPSAPQGRLL